MADHDQTLARDGHGILELDGNIDHAVDFVIAMVIRSVFTPVNDDASALAWMKSIPIAPGHPDYEAWISTVTRYYNGCSPSSACWPTRRARYGNLTAGIFAEMGSDFWQPIVQPPPLTPASSPCGQILSQEFLAPGAVMPSCDGRFLFAHQTDGNVVLYHEGAALWASGTDGWAQFKTTATS